MGEGVNLTLTHPEMPAPCEATLREIVGSSCGHDGCVQWT